jgi:hypothetical protein
LESPHKRDIPAMVKSFGLPCYSANDEASLKSALDQLYKPHDTPAVLHITTDALVSPKVLRVYFEQLRSE